MNNATDAPMSFPVFRLAANASRTEAKRSWHVPWISESPIRAIDSSSAICMTINPFHGKRSASGGARRQNVTDGVNGSRQNAQVTEPVDDAQHRSGHDGGGVVRIGDRYETVRAAMQHDD